MTGRVVVALALLVAVVLPFVGASYAVSFTIRLFLFVILAYSWNVISGYTGYTGYTSFGHTSFFGIGAYASALLVLHVKVHWAIAALVGGALAVVVALPLGIVMLRLRGSFFATGMFGLARVFEAVAFGWSSLTQGRTGSTCRPPSTSVPSTTCPPRSPSPWWSPPTGSTTRASASRSSPFARTRTRPRRSG